METLETGETFETAETLETLETGETLETAETLETYRIVTNLWVGDGKLGRCSGHYFEYSVYF